MAVHHSKLVRLEHPSPCQQPGRKPDTRCGRATETALLPAGAGPRTKPVPTCIFCRTAQ